MHPVYSNNRRPIHYAAIGSGVGLSSEVVPVVSDSEPDDCVGVVEASACGSLVPVASTPEEGSAIADNTMDKLTFTVNIHLLILDSNFFCVIVKLLLQALGGSVLRRCITRLRVFVHS